MAREFFVWAQNTMKKGACPYYRIEVPMNKLMEMDLAQVYVDDGKGRPESVKAMLYADIIQYYAIAGELVLHQVRSIKKRRPATRVVDGQKVTIYPPSVIYDIDDNVDYVHPFNPTYCFLGTRLYPGGELLEPGDNLSFDDISGQTHDLWQDKESTYDSTTFDIERNLYDAAVRHQIIRECDGATVASKNLKSYFEEVIGQKHVYVFPNTIIPEHYENYKLVPKDDRIRILWQGSQSHYLDWYPLVGAIKKICEKYRDKVTFIVFGEKFDWIHNTIPDDMLEYHDWAEYPAYKLKRGLLKGHINLCPLVDNPFNWGKSAIKWYEASIWDEPEATLAGCVEPYYEIEDGKTGLLYRTPEEFYEKLCLLIDNADLRTRLGLAARKWVLANRTPEATMPGLAEFYEDVRNRRKREMGGAIVQPYSMDEVKKLVTELKR